MKHIEAVIFDWAGTTVDYGCFAPLKGFIDAFASKGVKITPAEARGPMGVLKIDHIRALAAIPHTVAKNAPGSVYRVFFTFTLRKYTLIV